MPELITSYPVASLWFFIAILTLSELATGWKKGFAFSQSSGSWRREIWELTKVVIWMGRLLVTVWLFLLLAKLGAGEDKEVVAKLEAQLVEWMVLVPILSFTVAGLAVMLKPLAVRLLKTAQSKWPKRQNVQMNPAAEKAPEQPAEVSVEVTVSRKGARVNVKVTID